MASSMCLLSLLFIAGFVAGSCSEVLSFRERGRTSLESALVSRDSRHGHQQIEEFRRQNQGRERRSRHERRVEGDYEEDRERDDLARRQQRERNEENDSERDDLACRQQRERNEENVSNEQQSRRREREREEEIGLGNQESGRSRRCEGRTRGYDEERRGGEFEALTRRERESADVQEDARRERERRDVQEDVGCYMNQQWPQREARERREESARRAGRRTIWRGRQEEDEEGRHYEREFRQGSRSRPLLLVA